MLVDLPIKKHISTLKEEIVAIRGATAESKKELLTLQKQLKVLENRLQDPFNVVKEYFAVARDTLQANFQKESLLTQEQVAFLQEQIHQMIDDKVKATQNCMILEEKMRHLIEDIG